MDNDSMYHDGMRRLQDARETRPLADRLEKTIVHPAFTEDDRTLIQRCAMFFVATADARGRPDCSYKGGLPGFVRILDDHTLAFVDYSGNRQFITAGNLVDNPRAHLFLMDYENRQRIKIWGEARVVEGDAALTAQLMPLDYKARAEQVIVFTVTAWDANCPQHIPVRIDEVQVTQALAQRDQRIRELEAQVAQLRAGNLQLHPLTSA